MRAVCLTAVITIGMALATAKTTSAQPIHAYAKSIECKVINADLVFIAKIVDVGDARRVAGVKIYAATLAVERTLKREIHDNDANELMQLSIARSLPVITDWIEHSSRVLVCLDEDAVYANTVIELIPGKMEILTSDFTLLREPDEVVRAAEEALRRTSPRIKRVHTFRLDVPREHIANTKWAQYNGLVLTVPVDAQLEKRAVANLRSKNYSERRQAVRSLRYFKSDKNTSLVKAMLNDSGWAYLHHPQENNGVEVRLYGVRDAAYKTLKLWRSNVDKPMIREEITTVIDKLGRTSEN